MTSPGRRRNRNGRRYFDVALLALVCLVRVAPVFRGRVPFASDLIRGYPAWASVRHAGFRSPRHAEAGDPVTEFYPWRIMVANAWKRGAWPSWNPFVQCGSPLLASGQPGAFDPLGLPYLLLPGPWAWTLALYLEALIAALAARALAARLGASRAGALLSGSVFALGGAITAFQGWPHEHVLIWAPLLILAADRVAQEASARNVAWLSAAFALVIVGGHPEMTAYSVLVAAAFFAHHRFALRPDRAGRGRAWAGMAAGLAGGAALAGVLLVPMIAWLPMLARTLSLRFAPLPLADAAAFVSRDLRENPTWAGPVPEGAVYAGMLALLLAPLALLFPGRRRRRGAMLAGVALAAAAFAYGFPGTRRLWGVLPVLSGLRPWRWLPFAALAVALLAGLGLTALQRRAGRSGRAGAALLASSGAAALLLAVAAWHAGRSFWLRPLLKNAGALFGPFSSAAFLALGLALCLARAAGRLPPRGFARIALGLAILDVGSAAWGYLPGARPAEIFPPSPAMSFLAERTPPDQRVAAVDGAVHPNFFFAYGLRAVGGVEYLLARSRRFLSAASGRSLPVYTALFDSAGLLDAPPALLDLAGARYLVARAEGGSSGPLERSGRFAPVFSDGEVQIFENRSALPGAFVVPGSGVRPSADDGETLVKMSEPGFDPRAGAFVAASWRAAAAPSGRAGAGSGGGAVTYRRVSPGEIAVGVRGAEEGLLVVNEACAPGWGATVDGRREGVVRADVMFLGVPLPAGDHEVVFRYRPPGIRRGALLSLAGVICVGALWSLGRRSRRREIA